MPLFIETVVGHLQMLSEHFYRYRYFAIETFFEIPTFLRRPRDGPFSYHRLPYLKVRMTFVTD